MRSINPTAVRTPEGTVGCLVARHGLSGCVEFGQKRLLWTYPLGALTYLLPDTVKPGRKR
jgi:hypothetical protein